MRAFFERLALVVGGVAVALALGELALRIQAARVIGAKEEAVPPEIVGPPAPAWGILQVLRPNSTGVFQGVYYTLNSLGVRGPEYTPVPAPGVFRIAVVGDSVTMGHGVALEEAYPARIEAALNAKNGNQRYEVVNLGLSNLNIAAAADRLDKLGALYHPDLVVYGFTMNDIDGPQYRRAPKDQAEEYVAFYWRFRSSPSLLLRTLWPHVVNMTEIFEHPAGSYVGELYDNYFDNPEAWNVFDDHLGRIAQFASSRGICAHVLIHTHVVHLNFHNPFIPIYDQVAEAAERHGMTVTRSLPFFLGHDEQSLKVSWLDPHPNAAGHELHAQALLAGLEALPAHCWNKAHDDD